MKKILLFLFLLLSVVVLSEEKEKTFNPSNYIICIDPGHQTKGNNELEAIAPNSTKKKAKVTTGTRGVVTKKYESELMLEIALKLKTSLEKKGYKVIIVMPDTMSIERRATLKAYGAELILTDGTKGMGEAIAIAEKLAAENPNYFLPQQFNNKANPEKHYETTGKELLDDFKVIDAFVAGVGTGGTIVGVAKRLKERSKDTKVVGVEPSTSAVLSGEKPGKHSIQGIGTGFIPKNYDASVVDEIVKISSEEALEYAKKASHDFGLFVGISSGANIAAAYQVAKKLGKGKIVVTLAPDGGEKYLSVEAFLTK
mgnify:CR=1 FL=1